jgi:acetyltransferase-like isoleucine patch superfamily enzyme
MSNRRGEPTYMPPWQRALVALQEEIVGIHPRLHAYNLAASLLPLSGAGELRAKLFKLSGAMVGPGTQIHGPLKITGPANLLQHLQIGADCNLGGQCVLDLSDRLTIGDRVTLDPGVMILTSTHELDLPEHRAGPIVTNPVTIGEGAWLRARSVILPGVKIGAGAVVEAGAVVNKDVEPNARVGGIPAAKLEVLGGSK